MAVEHDFTSPLSHFDPADLLDALSTGIIMLDSHLCLTYANVGAQDLMAVSVNMARGRPFGDLFHDSQQLTRRCAARWIGWSPAHSTRSRCGPIGSTWPREPHMVDSR